MKYVLVLIYLNHAIATITTKPASTQLQHKLFGVKLTPHFSLRDLKSLGV